MNRRRWLFEHWGTIVEVSLDGALTGGEQCPGAWLRGWMEDWLRDDSDAWKVCALDRELGGRYPLRPDIRSLEDYRHAALRRITDAPR